MGKKFGIGDWIKASYLYLDQTRRRHVIQDLIFLTVATNLQHLCFFCGMSYNLQANFTSHLRHLWCLRISLSSRAAIASASIFVLASLSSRVNCLCSIAIICHSFIAFKFSSVNSKYIKLFIHLLFCNFTRLLVLPCSLISSAIRANSLLVILILRMDPPLPFLPTRYSKQV